MKYSTVNIKPNAFEPGWYVTFEDLPYDREDEGHQPHTLGFYHYPTEMGQKAAFEALRTCMIKQREIEIARLTESIAQLQALNLEEYQ